MLNSLRYIRLAGLLLATALLGTLAACSYTNAGTAPVPCNTPAVVSYATDIRPIFQAHCVECHNADYPGDHGGFDMAKFDQVQYWATTVKGKTGITWMVGNVSHASGFTGMPYQRDKLNDCDIALITKWAAAGAPQN